MKQNCGVLFENSKESRKSAETNVLNSDYWKQQLTFETNEL